MSDASGAVIADRKFHGVATADKKRAVSEEGAAHRDAAGDQIAVRTDNADICIHAMDIEQAGEELVGGGEVRLADFAELREGDQQLAGGLDMLFLAAASHADQAQGGGAGFGDRSRALLGGCIDNQNEDGEERQHHQQKQAGAQAGQAGNAPGKSPHGPIVFAAHAGRFILSAAYSGGKRTVPSQKSSMLLM